MKKIDFFIIFKYTQFILIYKFKIIIHKININKFSKNATKNAINYN